MATPTRRRRWRLPRSEGREPPPAGTATKGASRSRRRWLALGAATIVVVGLGSGLGVYFGTRQSTLSTARLMSLSPVPDQPAPSFTLTDQNGRTVSLASFRGKAVALYFMDPRCTDVCPLVAQEFIDADRLLGPLAGKTALIGVDVNPGYTARKWIDAFDAEHGLDHLSNWHFLTGSLSTLKAVWRDYSISVAVTASGEVQHSTVIDFVSPGGHERAIAVPFAYVHRNGTGWLPSGDVSRFGHGIAHELEALI